MRVGHTIYVTGLDKNGFPLVRFAAFELCHATSVTDPWVSIMGVATDP